MTIPCHIFFPLGTIASERFPTYHQKRNHEKDPCRVGFAATTPPAALPGPARPGELRPICASSGHAGGLFFRAGFGRKDRQRRPGRRAFCRDEKLRRFDAASENASQRRAFGGRLCQRFRLRQRCPAEPDATGEQEPRTTTPVSSAALRPETESGAARERDSLFPLPDTQRHSAVSSYTETSQLSRCCPEFPRPRPAPTFWLVSPCQAPRLFRGIRRAASLLSPPHAPHQHPRCLPDSSPPASPFQKTQRTSPLPSKTAQSS